MKKRYLLIGLLVVYSLLQLVVLSPSGSDSAIKFKAKNGRPLVIAHRGGAALFPENTAYAFEKSFEMGVDALEMDVHLTKDGVLVTNHDARIDRTSNQIGFVKEYTYEELKTFHFGSHFVDANGNNPFKHEQNGMHPISVEELFQKYAHRTLFLIEIKEDKEAGKQAVEQLKALIEKYGIVSDVNVTTFHADVHDYYRSIRDVNSPITASQKRATDMVYAMYGGYDFALSYDFEGMQFPTFHTVPLDTDYLIFKMHKHQKFVHYWTINDQSTMQQLIDKKVDGIITDRPDVLQTLLR